MRRPPPGPVLPEGWALCGVCGEASPIELALRVEIHTPPSHQPKELLAVGFRCTCGTFVFPPELGNTG